MTSAHPDDLRTWTGLSLSDYQLRAATAPLEPGLIVAGAGTGKTTVMAARVTWLVATGAVQPDEVLGLTFTTKAAGELSRRVREAVAVARSHRTQVAEREHPESDVSDASISTYHSFANSLVLEHGALVGAEPSARVLPKAALRQLAFRVLTRTSHEFEGDTVHLDTLVDGITALDSALSEHDVDPADLRNADECLIDELLSHQQQKSGLDMVATARRRRDLAALVVELRAEKQRLLVMDFADQLRWASQLAATQPHVAAQVRSRYKVVLLDEYQDTSVTQRRLMQNLFGNGHPVTAVGDPLQAIYAFRGASVRNIEEFPRHFPRIDNDGTRHEAITYSLTENRRSRQAILDIANLISQPLRDGNDIEPLVAAGQRDYPTAHITCAFHDTELDEFAWVANEVVRVHEAGHPWSDVAVLLRAMSRAGDLRDALAQRGVPVEIVGVEGLIGLPEVIEIISVLRLLHDPGANPDCVRLLAGPRWRIGPRDLALLGRRASELAAHDRRRRGLGVDDTLNDAVATTDPSDLISLLDALDDLGDSPLSDDARTRMTALATELRTLRRHVGEPLADLVQRVLDVTGFEAELLAQLEEVARQRLASLHAFVALAAEFRDLDGRSTLGGFLRFLADAQRFDASPDAMVPNATTSVRIMSAHKSKGLEFPVVVLPCLVEGTFPSSKGLAVWPTVAKAIPFEVLDEDPPRELPVFPSGPIPTASETALFREAVRQLSDLEETRLAYVAVTRAETTLIASGARWALSGAAKPREASRYLENIATLCASGHGEVAMWSNESDYESNPLAVHASVTWPVVDDPRKVQARHVAADLVRARRNVVTSLDQCSLPSPDFVPIVAGWDADLTALLAEAERDGQLERSVPLPTSLSATELQRLIGDEESFTMGLVRPMPRPPSPAARRGTRFHAWVESLWGQQPLLEPDDLPGAADADIDSDDELEAMKRTFETMAYAAITPAAIEEPFALVLAGRVVPGRIDAVFRYPDASGNSALDRWEVVDWKTNRSPDADPLQLAVYRLAWAERLGVPLEQVVASFVYVRLGEVRTFDSLPDRAELERLISASG